MAKHQYRGDAIPGRTRLLAALVPLILAMYIAASLNRVNVSFAALQPGNPDRVSRPRYFGWGNRRSFFFFPWG